MPEYIVRSHQLALPPNDRGDSGQVPHSTYALGAIVELDDGDPATQVLVLQGAVQSKRAADQAAKAEASSHQLESEVGKHEAPAAKADDRPAGNGGRK